MFLEIGSVFVYFWGAAKLRWAGGAQRPVGRGNEPKKTGARSARARKRGQNPLVYNNCIDTVSANIIRAASIGVPWNKTSFEGHLLPNCKLLQAKPLPAEQS